MILLNRAIDRNTRNKAVGKTSNNTNQRSYYIVFYCLVECHVLRVLKKIGLGCDGSWFS